MRRQRVLSKLNELHWINEAEMKQADEYPLPVKEDVPTIPAPYFVDAVRRRLRDLDVDLKDGARIYTTMVPQAQMAAQKAVQQGLDALENWYATRKKKRDEKNQKRNQTHTWSAPDPPAQSLGLNDV